MIRCRFSRLGGDGSDSEDLPLNDDLWLMFGSRADGKHMQEVFVCVYVFVGVLLYSRVTVNA